MFGYYCKVVLLTKLFVLVQFPSTSRNIITLKKKVFLSLKLTLSKTVISKLSKLVFYLKYIFCISPSTKQCIFSILIDFNWDEKFMHRSNGLSSWERPIYLCFQKCFFWWERPLYLCFQKYFFCFFCIVPSVKQCIFSNLINFIWDRKFIA